MDIVYGPESVGGDSPLLFTHARRVGYMLQDVWRDDRTASRAGMAVVARRHVGVGVVWGMVVRDKLMWAGGFAIGCREEMMVATKVQGYLYAWMCLK
jgi:hypothetical protein